MCSNFQGLNIIDLISEKHAKLRKMVIEAWVESGEERVSDTESYMLALIEKNELTVAQIGRIIGISRQGAHKCAKSLIERGYLTMENRNYRGKELLLTDKGIRFCRETLILKEKFEEEIKNNINSFIVRKGAHMFLFCVLGILLFGSMYNGDNILKSVFIALLLAFLYACSDEYHQTFVVGRTGQFNDVLIDFSGAFIGVLIVSLIVKLNIFKKKIQVTK